MKRSLKLFMSALTALIVPTLGWAAESINIKLNSGTFDADGTYGCYPVKGSEWQTVGGAAQVTDSVLTGGEKVSYATSALWSMGSSGLSAHVLLNAYLDDGAVGEGGTTISVSGLNTTTYANYDVLIYMTADTTPSVEKHFFAPTVNGTQYTVGGAGSDNWGSVDSPGTPAIGVNCLHVTGLTATAEDSTLTISVPGIAQADRGAGRACISAIQIIPTAVLDTNIDSISFYVTSGYGNAYAEGYYGWTPVLASSWNSLSNSVEQPKDNSGETITTAKVLVNDKGGAWYHTAPVQLGGTSRGYYDGQWDLDIKGIPYSEYKVVLFMATDNSDKTWGPVKVTSGGAETYYSYDTDKNLTTVADASTTYNWGATATANGTEGVDVMVIPGLSGDINLLTHGTSNNRGDSTTRGGLFAMQIINTGTMLDPKTYTAAPAGDVTFSEIAWKEGELVDMSINKAEITLVNGATLTMDTVMDLGEVTIKTATASDVVTVEIPSTEPADIRAILNALNTASATGIVKTTLGAYTGKAAWMAYEFNGDYTNTGSEGSSLSWDGGGAFGNGSGTYTAEMMVAAHTDADENGNRALRLPARPWRNVNSGYPAAYTAVMYAKAGTTPNGVLVSFGSATGGQQNTVTLATGANPDKDEMRLVQCGNLQSVATDLVQNLAVPNSQAAYHLYAFAMYTKDGNSRAEVYVDGELLTTYTFDGEIALGTGLQVGSIHGGVGASGLQALAFTKTEEGVLTDYDPATMDFIRVYDCLLSEEMIQQMAEDYPYTSPSGTATRELDGTSANWVEEADPATAWSQVTLNADAMTTTTVQNAPNNGTNIVLNASAATEVTVNLPAETGAYETLTINGDVTFVAGEATEALAVSGRTTINGDVTVPYDLVHLSTVTVKSGKKLTIDASHINLAKIYTTETIGLTGMIDVEDGAEVVIKEPAENVEGRTLEILESESGYSLKVTFSGTLTATVPEAGATWSALEWKLGETVIAEENLPEDFAEIPVTLIAEEGAALTLEEDTSLGGLTVQGADLTLSGDYALNVDPATLITTTAIIVDEKAMLDLSEAAVAGLTQNVKGTGTVTVKMTADYDNVITLEGFTGTTAVAAGYFSIDASSVGSTLRLFNGTRVQTISEGGKTDATLNIVLEGTVQFYANTGRPYATTGTITGGTLDKQGGDTLTAAAITSTLALNVGDVVINPGEGNATTMENPVSGSQPLTIASGTVTMTAANGNYGGAITVAEGATLKASGENHVPFGTGAITNNGTIDISPTTKSVISGVISGTGDVIVNSGTLELYAANTYTGATTIVANTALTLGEGASIGAGDLVLNGTLTGSATIASDKTISGTGTITGTLTLADGAIIDATSGALTVTGAVTLPTEGTVIINVTGLAADATILTCDVSTLDLENITLTGVADGLLLTVNEDDTALVLVADDDNESVIVPEGTTEEEFEAAWALLVSKLTPKQLEDLTEITNPDAATIINGCGVDLDGTVATLTYDFKVSEISFGESGITVKVELGAGQSFAEGVAVTLVDLEGEKVGDVAADGTATFTTEADTLLFKAKAAKKVQTN